MKLNVSKEYIRIRKVLKLKLNRGNLVHGVNTWAVFLLRYSAAFVSWKTSKLQDRKTRKLFTIYGAWHPKSDVDRLYYKRRRKSFDIHRRLCWICNNRFGSVCSWKWQKIQAATGDKIDGLEPVMFWRDQRKRKD